MQLNRRVNGVIDGRGLERRPVLVGARAALSPALTLMNTRPRESSERLPAAA